MATTKESLQAFLDATDEVALVGVARAKGSTPREAGTYMLVSPMAIHGTIGGGQLEFMAIDQARQMLTQAFSPREAEMSPKATERATSKGAAKNTSSPAGATPPGGFAATLSSRGKEIRATLDIPLGPEIGQCCGGRVELAIRLVDEALKSELVRASEEEDARLPHVYVFGGGHVGQALARTLSLLPLKAVVVETRADALEGMPAHVETRLTSVPEEMVRSAPAGAAFVVLTHDHALDFLIVAEALRRKDAAYVGMIGSRTKKATFRSWYLKSAGGNEADFPRLVTPIGGDAVKDKRPAVIAALAAAEIMSALAACSTANAKAIVG